MTTITIFGGTGYVGGHITAEALRRGHLVISVSRTDSGELDKPDLIRKTGDIHDAALVDKVTTEADVLVVAVRASAPGNGPGLAEAVPFLAGAAATHSTRLAFVGGAGTLRVSEGGPRIVDQPDFPAAHKGESLAQADVLAALRETPANVDWFYLSPAAEFGGHKPGEATGQYRTGTDVVLRDSGGTSYISGADYATAFLDEIERPNHHRARFTVAY